MFNIRKLKSLRKSKPRVRGFSSAARHEAGRASVEARELELFQELAKKYLPSAVEKPKYGPENYLSVMEQVEPEGAYSGLF